VRGGEGEKKYKTNPEKSKDWSDQRNAKKEQRRNPRSRKQLQETAGRGEPKEALQAPPASPHTA